MKKILFLLLLTVAGYGQTLQNPTFGNTTTNTLKIKTNTESVTGTNKIPVQETDGTVNWIQSINIPIPYIPTGYLPTAPNIGGHLTGINNKLNSIVATTAGVTTRVWFTADVSVVSATNYYATNATSKGTLASAIQNVVNNDNVKTYFAQDLIGAPFVTATLFPPGVYAGNLSASTSPNSAQQRWTVELYKCNNAGTPIASGVTGAPVGSLGVTVVTILDSGLLTLADGSVTNVQVSGNLGGTGLSMAVGERVRYHVSAEKVGTAGANITQSVYYGTSYNSYIDVPVPLNTTAVQNLSSVVGTTATDALNTLNVGLISTDADKVIRSDIAVTSASNKRNDQSSMLRLNDGRLAIAYSRFGVPVEDEDPAAIYVKFSSDNGKTWTAESSLIPTVSLGSLIPSMYKKANGNILVVYHVTEQITPSNLSSIRQVEFNPTLTSIVTASSIIVPSGQYTSIASDRIYFDSVSNRLLMPYPLLTSGTGSSTNSVYNTKILVSSNEGTSWTDSGLTINGFVDLNGFGGALEPGIFENKGKITVYSRNLIGSVGACDLTWGGSSYTKGSEYKMSLKAMNSQETIKYSSFLKGWVASVTRLYDQPTSSERRQIDLLFSKDLNDWLNLYTLEDITQTSGFMALEPNIFIDEKVYVSYSYASNSSNYDLKSVSFPFSTFSNTESKLFKTFTTNPDNTNYNRISSSEISLTPSFNSSIFGNILENKISINDNVVVSVPASNSFYSHIADQQIINTSSGVKNLNLGVNSVFSPQQIVDKVHIQGQLSRIFIPGFTDLSLKNSSVIDQYSAIQIPRILEATASGTITTKYAINQEYSGDANYFAGNIGVGVAPTIYKLQVAGDIALASTSNTIYTSNIGSWSGNLNYNAGGSGNKHVFAGGNIQVNALAGTGTRQVVALSDGSLAATDIAPTSGTYTPTVSGIVNTSTAVLAGNPTYTRIGNVVTVTVGIQTTVPAITTQSQITITLPINRTITTTQYVGSGSLTNNSSPPSTLTANIPVGVTINSGSTTTATCYFNPTSTLNTWIGSVTFQYSIN